MANGLIHSPSFTFKPKKMNKEEAKERKKVYHMNRYHGNLWTQKQWDEFLSVVNQCLLSGAPLDLSAELFPTKSANARYQIYRHCVANGTIQPVVNHEKLVATFETKEDQRPWTESDVEKLRDWVSSITGAGKQEWQFIQIAGRLRKTPYQCIQIYRREVDAGRLSPLANHEALTCEPRVDAYVETDPSEQEKRRNYKEYYSNDKWGSKLESAVIEYMMKRIEQGIPVQFTSTTADRRKSPHACYRLYRSLVDSGKIPKAINHDKLVEKHEGKTTREREQRKGKKTTTTTTTTETTTTTTTKTTKTITVDDELDIDLNEDQLY